MGNISQLNKVRAIDINGGSSFWANFTSDTPQSLLGQPAYEASDLSATTTGTSASCSTCSTRGASPTIPSSCTAPTTGRT
jgi:hypothetical protein